ncbi:unnamed protein product, partial [Vitis vinifera]|uniref:Uncharacterized protein n=1 Tax=Vitis vinifera TaxID=29760 RepID=D7TGY0_VITVI
MFQFINWPNLYSLKPETWNNDLKRSRGRLIPGTEETRHIF